MPSALWDYLRDLVVRILIFIISSMFMYTFSGRGFCTIQKSLTEHLSLRR